MQSIADLDVFDAVLRMIEETAVTDNCILAARDDGKLRWDSGAIPICDLVDESDGFFVL